MYCYADEKMTSCRETHFMVFSEFPSQDKEVTKLILI